MLFSQENNGVNYTKSTFCDSSYESQKIKINHYDDLLELQTSDEDDSEFWTEKEVDEQIIVFDQKMDIYSPVTLSTTFYFSKRLKERLKNEGIAGMKFYSEEEDLEFYLDE